jgi:hypothetical protein
LRVRTTEPALPSRLAGVRFWALGRPPGPALASRPAQESPGSIEGAAAMSHLEADLDDRAGFLGVVSRVVNAIAPR